MLRNATKKEAKAVIALLSLAMEEIAQSLTGEQDEAKILQILQEFFIKKSNRLSYENVIVFVVEGEVVGAICAYNGLMARELDEPFISRLQNLGKTTNITPECDENALYIDSLAVLENFRGRKIAQILIEKVCQKAKILAIPKVALIVDERKEKLRKYYENLGFCAVKKKRISKHDYIYMTKDLR